MRRWVLIGLVCGVLATGAHAACDPGVGAGASDSRTGLAKLNYLYCHWETVYNALIDKLWNYLAVSQTCASLSGAGASDDNVPFFIARRATQVRAVACRCEGTCTAPVATVQVEETSGGSAIVLASTLTCSTGTSSATWVDTTTNVARDLVAGEALRFDVTNTPGSADWLTVCVETADTL